MTDDTQWKPLESFWKREIRGKFREEILEDQVQINDSLVRYVNLDNAATTKPFRSVEERIWQEMVR